MRSIAETGTRVAVPARMKRIAMLVALAACGSDAAPAPDTQQLQQIADGTGASVPAVLATYTLAGRMDAPASSAFVVDIFGFHVDAAVTCRDATGEPLALCDRDRTNSIDYSLNLDGVLDLPGWHGALRLDADYLVARGPTTDDHLITGTSHLELSSSSLDRQLAIDTSADLDYHPSTNALTGTVALGVDATLQGATTHVEDALLTLTPAGKLHLRVDGDGCFTIDAVNGVATAVSVATCE